MKPINGWTKAKMIETIQNRMGETVAKIDRPEGGRYICQYKTANNTRCAVGVFLPENHPGEQTKGDVFDLIGKYSDLTHIFPLKPIELFQLQQVHDAIPFGMDARSACIRWITDNIGE